MQSYTVKAPVRADLCGGTLDLWPIYCLLGSGKTINIALDLFAEAHFEVASNDRFQAEVKVPDFSPFIFESPLTPEEVRKLDPKIQFPVGLLSLYLSGKTLPNQIVKMKVETSAPKGSGLGGSSALAVAITTGIAKVFNDFVDQGWQWSLLNWVRDAEANFLQTPTGTQDYLAALFGGFRCYTYETGKISESSYSPSAMTEFEKRAIVLYSGETHSSGLSNWEIYKAVFDGKREALRGFKAIRDLSESVDQCLSASKIDWTEIGGLLSHEWDERQRTFHVNTPRLDEIIKFLSDLGVLGAKVCGAAQGGSLLVLTDPKDRTPIVQACRDKGIHVLETKPTTKGVQVIPQSLQV